MGSDNIVKRFLYGYLLFAEFTVGFLTGRYSYKHQCDVAIDQTLEIVHEKAAEVRELVSTTSEWIQRCGAKRQ